MTTKREAQKVLREVFGRTTARQLSLFFRGALATYYGEGELCGYRVWYFVSLHRIAPPAVWVTTSPVPSSKPVLCWDPWIRGESRSMSQLYLTEADITTRVLRAML